jgi:predicted SnoaL-like aldol condensation-catalyzing enzyme
METVTHTPAQTTAAEEFVTFFEELWAVGSTDPERFFRMLDERTTPDTVLSQPMAAPVRGPAGARELFGTLFEAIPDLKVDVLRWGPTSDGALLEIRLHGTLGGRPLAWEAVDRFVLSDGKIAARHSYFDPLPLGKAMALSPRTSVKLLPSLINGRRRR